MHHAQYRFQTFTRIWYFTSISGISKVDCKVDLLTGLLQPLFQEQVDLHTGPTSTSVSGTSWLQSWSAHWAYFNLCFRNKLIAKLICTLGLLQPLFQEQSWSAHWAYFNLCFRNKVDLLTGPTSTSISGTSWLQSWSAHWAYFNLCFRNKVDLHTGPTIRTKHIQERWDSSAGRPSDRKARCNTDVQVWVPSVARDFSPTASFQCRLSHGVCTAPACNRMHQHLCPR